MKSENGYQCGIIAPWERKPCCAELSLTTVANGDFPLADEAACQELPFLPYLERVLRPKAAWQQGTYPPDNSARMLSVSRLACRINVERVGCATRSPP